METITLVMSILLALLNSIGFSYGIYSKNFKLIGWILVIIDLIGIISINNLI